MITIVDILGSIDDKIENNNKIICTLIKLSKRKFDILSKISNIPASLGDLCKEVVCGTTPSTKDSNLWSGNIPFITTPDMNGKIFVHNTDRHVTFTKKIQKRIINDGSISVSCIGTIGVIAMATEPSLTNQQINTIIPFENQNYYLYNLLQTNVDAIKSIATGSATPNLNKETFIKLEVLTCSIDKIYKYNEQVTPIYEKVKLLEQENQKLDELKQLYLKQFFD